MYTLEELYAAWEAGGSGMSFASATGVSEDDLLRTQEETQEKEEK